ncbi:hypothetical protein BC832DRAFT_415711 [Gaertneriomyces semiglobifer]|nr:hypothetical protein BC832DRAFT_415711 [Gaertneriomyces semiglobifer]
MYRRQTSPLIRMMGLTTKKLGRHRLLSRGYSPIYLHRSELSTDHTEPQGVEAAPEHVESTDEPEIAPEDFFTLPDPNAEYPIEDYSEPVGPSKAGHTAPTPAQYSVSAQYAYPPPGASDSYYQQFYQDPNDIYSYTTAEPFAAGPEIPEEVLKAFGTRDRKLEDNIQYKEINQSQLIDNNAWQMQAARQLSMDQSTGLTGSTLKPSSGQKRKHNIMSLAFEAKQREAALKEAAANRMANKAARRAKYGF